MLRRFGVKEGVECMPGEDFYTYLLLFIVFECMQAVNVHVVGDGTSNTLPFSS